MAMVVHDYLQTGGPAASVLATDINREVLVRYSGGLP